MGLQLDWSRTLSAFGYQHLKMDDLFAARRADAVTEDVQNVPESPLFILACVLGPDSDTPCPHRTRYRDGIAKPGLGGQRCNVNKHAVSDCL